MDKAVINEVAPQSTDELDMVVEDKGLTEECTTEHIDPTLPTKSTDVETEHQGPDGVLIKLKKLHLSPQLIPKGNSEAAGEFADTVSATATDAEATPGGTDDAGRKPLEKDYNEETAQLPETTIEGDAIVPE